MRGLWGPIKRASPLNHGWRREAKLDHLIQVRHPGWETWRTPENVVMGLPPNCVTIGLQEHHAQRGVTLVCVEPKRVFSIWKSDGKGGAISYV